MVRIWDPLKITKNQPNNVIGGRGGGGGGKYL